VLESPPGVAPARVPSAESVVVCVVGSVKLVAVANPPLGVVTSVVAVRIGSSSSGRESGCKHCFFDFFRILGADANFVPLEKDALQLHKGKQLFPGCNHLTKNASARRHACEYPIY
jgi:hypothetical protein